MACRHDDPLAAIPEHPWSVFGDRRFLAMSPEAGLCKMAESGLAQAGVSVERLFNCSAATTMAALVTAGLSISALSRLVMAQLASPSLVWRPLVELAVARSIGIVRHNARSLSPAAQAFVRELEKQARAIRMSDQLSANAPDQMPVGSA